MFSFLSFLSGEGDCFYNVLSVCFDLGYRKPVERNNARFLCLFSLRLGLGLDAWAINDVCRRAPLMFLDVL